MQEFDILAYSGGKLGIGVDIEEIERFQGLAPEKDARFLNRLFTPGEIEYCFAGSSPAQHLAARFCGKEAVIKALNCLKTPVPAYRDIEIANGPSGMPFIKVKGDSFGHIDFLISLSHCAQTAIAFVIACSKSPGNG